MPPFLQNGRTFAILTLAIELVLAMSACFGLPELQRGKLEARLNLARGFYSQHSLYKRARRSRSSRFSVALPFIAA